MDELWPYRSPPETGSGRSTVWRGEPATWAELSAQRSRLRSAVVAGGRPPDDDDLHRLLLVFEELGTNGLRHGRPPVRVTVDATGTGWLLEVSDSGVADPPVPAVGRDAAEGGLGLYMVARLCADHGWDVRGDRKHVWGRVDAA